MPGNARIERSFVYASFPPPGRAHDTDAARPVCLRGDTVKTSVLSFFRSAVYPGGGPAMTDNPDDADPEVDLSPNRLDAQLMEWQRHPEKSLEPAGPLAGAVRSNGWFDEKE